MGGFSKLISSLITCYIVLSSKNTHFWLKKQTNKNPKHVSDKKLKSSLVSEIIVDSWSDFVQSLSHSFISFVTPTNQVKFSFPRSTSGPSCTWKWFWRRAEQSPLLPRCAVGWHPLPQLYLHINTGHCAGNALSIRRKTERLFASGMRVDLIWKLIFSVFCCGQYFNLSFLSAKNFPCDCDFPTN